MEDLRSNNQLAAVVGYKPTGTDAVAHNANHKGWPRATADGKRFNVTLSPVEERANSELRLDVTVERGNVLSQLVEYQLEFSPGVDVKKFHRGFLLLRWEDNSACWNASQDILIEDLSPDFQHLRRINVRYVAWDQRRATDAALIREACEQANQKPGGETDVEETLRRYAPDLLPLKRP